MGNALVPHSIYDKDGLWKHEYRKVSDVHPNPKNPRTITEQSLQGLRQSMKDNVYTHRIIIDQNNKILSGHARWLVLKQDDPDAVVEVLVAQRPLTEQEEKNAILGHNVLGGSWDIDAIQMNFDPIDWGKYDLNFDLSDVPQDNDPDKNEQKSNSVTFTDEEFVIVQDAINLAKDVLQIDPQSSPRPGAIVAICNWFLAKIKPEEEQ